MINPLTRREAEVIEHAARGMTRAESADRMGISTEGVKQHLRHISNKWGTYNITHSVAIAVREGICTP